jgi:deoxyribonuclease-4
LINVAAADVALRRRSIEALVEEYDRTEALGLQALVMHPGAYTTGDESGGLALIVDALEQVFARRPEHRARILLEHTAGQGTSLGHRFEHLASIVEGLRGSVRVGVCLDTCHLVAAGYDIVSPEGFAATFRDFDRLVGLRRIQAFHLNDSKRPCGSRIDRHEHIGDGCLGLETFRRLLNDRRFARLPMLLETPKSEDRTTHRVRVDPWDARNLDRLRSLLRPRVTRESGSVRTRLRALRVRRTPRRKT